MRTALIVMGMGMGVGLVLLGGCDRDQRRYGRADGLDRHRWQLVQQPDAAAVWRLDATTGALSYCHADFTNRIVLCMPQAVAPTEAGAATAAPGTQPAAGAPIYPAQPRAPAP